MILGCSYFVTLWSCDEAKDSCNRSRSSAACNLPSACTTKNFDKFDYVRHVFLSSKSVQPKNGIVPDAKTAVAIAYAVALPIYGEQAIHSELPFRSQLKNGSWIVLGTLNCKNCMGGTIMVQIDQRSGRILYINHSM